MSHHMESPINMAPGIPDNRDEPPHGESHKHGAWDGVTSKGAHGVTLVHQLVVAGRRFAVVTVLYFWSPPGIPGHCFSSLILSL
jgi:hypothetical protein